MQSSSVGLPPGCSPCTYTGVRAHLCVLGMTLGEDKMGQKLGAEGSPGWRRQGTGGTGCGL